MWTTPEVPDKWKRSAKTCLTMNDKFVYCHWTDAELEEFIADEYPWFLSTYLAYPYVIQRCDVARYLLLYRYGGIYVDLDVICRTPMSSIFSSAPPVAGVLVAPTQPFGVTQEFIAVRRPRDPVIRDVVAGLRRAAASPWYPPLPYTAVMFRTGPVYFTRRLDCHADDGAVFVIPSRKYDGADGSYVSHVAGSSWHSWDGRLLWKMFQLRRPLFLAAVLLLAVVVVFACLCRKRRFMVDCLRRFGITPSRTQEIFT